MCDEQTWTELVGRAQQGRQDDMNLLASSAAPRVRAYIYRVTLDHDLTEDLSQEVLLQMFKSLEQLNETEHFWPWLYRVAQSKIQQHFKVERRRASASDAAFCQDSATCRRDSHQNDGLREAIRDELSTKVMAAMRQIKRQYRAVLALRCFEQLSYADIGVAMQCSEVRARVLFFRAKQALKKQLGRQGLSKSFLLMSLGLFGTLTAPAEAGSPVLTVTEAATQVGLTAAALATAGSRQSLAALTAVVVLISIVVLSLRPGPPVTADSPFSRADVTSLHFTAQVMDGRPQAGGSLSKGAYEQWFHFPEGIDGPMHMRMQRWDVQQTERLCAWLENNQGNYYYDSLKNCVHIMNGRVCWSNLKVRRLPTDTAEFTEFLSHVEGDLGPMSQSVRDPNTGLLVSFVQYQFRNAPNFRTDYAYNTVSAGDFQYAWPADIPVIDDRDAMHQRGWTYFQVAGRVNGRQITGRGRIPFVFEAAKAHPAWMSLRIGNNLEIIDCRGGACLQRRDGSFVASYPAGTFFNGLARPWTGMHAADVIRRDAVEQRVGFESKYAQNDTEVIVALYCDDEQVNTDLIYTIDMENDLIREIVFAVNDQANGSLTFSYLQNIEHAAEEFTEPTLSLGAKPPSHPGPGTMWLSSLARGNLGG